MSEEKWTIEKAVETVGKEDKLALTGEGEGRSLLGTRAEICAYMEIHATTKRDALADYWAGRIDAETMEAKKKWNDKLGARILFALEGEEPFGADSEEPWRWIWFAFVRIFKWYWTEGAWSQQFYKNFKKLWRETPPTQEESDSLMGLSDGYLETHHNATQRGGVYIQYASGADFDEKSEHYRETTLKLLSQYALAFEYCRRFFQDADGGGDACERVIKALMDAEREG